MEKRLDCREVGLDCDDAVCAQTDEEVIKKAEEHIQTVHGMRGFSKEFYDKARGAIHEGSCEPGEDISSSK